MTNVNPYLELLKEAVIDTCSATDSSINQLYDLKMEDFRKMFGIIKQTLEKSTLLTSKQKQSVDTAVSISTLRRIFKYGYSPNKKDARVINSLVKLSIFIGYRDWETFIIEKQKQFNIKDASLERILETLVRNANQAEFNAYLSLPAIATNDLDRYFVATGTAYMRIYNILVQHRQKQWTISNKDNPSGYTINKIWLERVNSKEAVVKTQEYWYLRWFELTTSRYRHIYNEENAQTWTLIFVDGLWKVLSTYYPP